MTPSPHPAEAQEREAPNTPEMKAIGAFLAAMHENNLDGAKVREAMEWALGRASNAPATSSGDAPDHIWLDLGDAPDGVPFRELQEVTWSEDNASGKGIRYVRDGLASHAHAPATASDGIECWATHHDEPMLFPTFDEALAHCDEDEQPIRMVPEAASGEAEAESFLEVADVQDESGINTYYSRELVLQCIDAALAKANPAAGEITGSCSPCLEQQTGVRTHGRSDENSNRGTYQESTGGGHAGRCDATRASGLESGARLRGDGERGKIVAEGLASQGANPAAGAEPVAWRNPVRRFYPNYTQHERDFYNFGFEEGVAEAKHLNAVEAVDAQRKQSEKRSGEEGK